MPENPDNQEPLEDNDELESLKQALKQPMDSGLRAENSYQGPCPRCGYCPHCGRGGDYYRPFYPLYPNPIIPYIY